MRLEGLDTVLLVKLLDRVVRHWILQVAKHARLRRTNFNTRWFESTRNPVVTQRALLCGLGDWIEKPAAVGASLDTKTATDAIFGINQHRAIRRVERSTDRAD